MPKIGTPRSSSSATSSSIPGTGPVMVSSQRGTYWAIRSASAGYCGRQLGHGFGVRPAAIMLEMPFRRHDVREEPIQPRRIGNQFAIESADVPTIEDIADVEHDRADLRHRPRTFTTFPREGRNQPWRALKRRLVLLMT